MQPLLTQPLTTRTFKAHENLEAFIMESVPQNLIQEKMVIAITSKIVSLSEGQLINKESTNKIDLVRAESDYFFGEIGYGCFLTIKEGLLIPSAGIDESNSESGDYILFPKKPYASAEKLWHGLKKAWGLSEFGIIFTDSHTSPLRRGVTGICLSYFGFHGVKNLVGTPDLFGRELKMTQMNYADGLASTAVMMMGEGKESRPLCILQNAELEFTDKPTHQALQIPMKDDLYLPLFQAMEKFVNKS